MSVALQPVAISADGSSLLQHTADDVSSSDGVAALKKEELTGSVSFEPSNNTTGNGKGSDAQAVREQFLQFYDIVATAAFIASNRCVRIALQFPDEMLRDAANVVAELNAQLQTLLLSQQQQGNNTSTEINSTVPSTTSTASTPPFPQLFILADTSYGSCCVDEVAAQHANCDLIVHYGFSCLSRTRRLPVRFVFGRRDFNVDACARTLLNNDSWKPEEDSYSFGSSFSSSASAEKPVDAVTMPPVSIVVLYSLEYAHAIDEGTLPRAIQAEIEKQGSNGRKFVVSLARVQKEQAGNSAAAADSCASKPASGCCGSNPSASACCNKNGTSSTVSLPAASSAEIPSAISSPAVTASSDSASCIDTTSKALLFSSAHHPITEPPTAFHLNGFTFHLPQSTAATKEQLHQVNFVWIGPSSDHTLLNNCILIFNSNPFHLYQTSAASSLTSTTDRLKRDLKNQSKTLARRYYLMEKLKNTDRIGILVGTLGVKDYLAVISYLQRLILNAGKKSYLFIVGKLNEAKLSNFAEIDAFVLIACPLNTMFDSKGFYRDVVTPYECNLALKGGAWNGDYHTDFASILPAGLESSTSNTSTANTGASVEQGEEHDSEEDELSDDLAHGMRFDPLTGKMRAALPSQLHAHGITLSDTSSLTEDEKRLYGDALVTTSSNSLVRVEGGQLVEIKNASDHFLNQRSFKGLQVKQEGEDGTEVAKIEQGLEGIARSYVITQQQQASAQK